MTPLERAALAVEARIGTHCPSCEVEMPGGPHEIVRAVLQAIREPSEAMRICGRRVASAEMVNDEPCLEDGAEIATWQAMIDAAMEEG